jgi:heat shock protein HslJ|tara:strand:- start:25380 stop:26489 length:1110 start_codon:yes stop_codon:yes gene_type:complete
MKKLTTLLLVFIAYTTYGQIPEIFEETWHLRFLKLEGDSNYSPLGVISNINFEDNGSSYSAHANGVQNGLIGEITFSGDTFTFTDISISLLDCDVPNCYYENLYFQDFLTTETFDLKTFTYDYFASSLYDYKSLRLTDSEGNVAFYVNTPIGMPDEALLRTWHLHSMDADLGEDSDYIANYNPPISPTLTINQDLSFTGTGSCNDFSGQFFYTNDNFSGARLIANDFQETGEICEYHNGLENYYFSQFMDENGELYFLVDENSSSGEASFSFDLTPGFTFNFRNFPVLATNEETVPKFYMYPNPVDDKLFIKTTNAIIDSVQIFDSLGKLVMKEVDFQNGLTVSSLETGIYFIQIKSSKGHTVKKFIKK